MRELAELNRKINTPTTLAAAEWYEQRVRVLEVQDAPPPEPTDVQLAQAVERARKASDVHNAKTASARHWAEQMEMQGVNLARELIRLEDEEKRRAAFKLSSAGAAKPKVSLLVVEHFLRTEPAPMEWDYAGTGLDISSWPAELKDALSAHDIAEWESRGNIVKNGLQQTIQGLFKSQSDAGASECAKAQASMDLLAKGLREKAEAAVAIIKKRKLDAGRSEASELDKPSDDDESMVDAAARRDAGGNASSSSGAKGGGKGTKGGAPVSAGKGGGAPSAKGKKGKLEELTQEKSVQLGAEIGAQQRKALAEERSGQLPSKA